MLSVIVPAFNEQDRLPATLDTMRRFLDASGEEYEVLVVDDGSTDETARGAIQLTKEWGQLRVITLDPNQGKGAAVQAGMLAARGEWRLFSDADLSTPMEELAKLRTRLGPNCQVAIGSRAQKGAVIEVHQPGRRELMGRAYNLLVRMLALPGVHDSQCGFKLFTAAAAEACFRPLQTKRFGFDAEVLVRAKRLGLGVCEVPVRWHHVEASTVSSIRDSWSMLIDLIRLRLATPKGRGLLRAEGPEKIASLVSYPLVKPE